MLADCCHQVLQDEQDLREEQRKKKEGLFQRTGRFRRSTSPPSRNLSLSLSRHHDSTLPCLDPSPSVTLLSLSSLSDCNSTKSLLPSDPDDYPLTPVTGLKTPAAPPAPALNPLLDLRAESFKKEPNQSLTPTHVSAAMALNRGHRRTPSEGAIRPRAQTMGHHRTPSDGSMPMPPPPGAPRMHANKGERQIVPNVSSTWKSFLERSEFFNISFCIVLVLLRYTGHPGHPPPARPLHHLPGPPQA